MCPQREDEDVEVARRPCEAAKPGEFSREVLDAVGWKHVLELAKQRSRAPERDAEVVQELGVEVRAESRLVGD